MGLAMGAIATGETGYVTAFGAIRGVNTSGFSDGVILYANPTGTGLTATKPTGTHVVAAVCISAANNGTLLVRPTIGGYVETTDATSDATPNTIVKRDGSGNSSFVGVQTNSLNASEGIETFSAYIKGESYYDTAATFAYESPAAATHRTALGLGTAATANSSAFATASHTHGNISNGGTIGTTADLAVVTGTGGALTVTSRSGIDSRTSFPNADVTAATTNATPNTLVRRNEFGDATFGGIAADALEVREAYITETYWVGNVFSYSGGAAGSGAISHRTALGLTSLATTTAGTGVTTALSVNVGSSGAFVVNGGALGTPSSGTLTNATGLPISTGVAGLGSGVATFLATPTSANLAAAVTDELGDGRLLFDGATRDILDNRITDTPFPVFFDEFLPVAGWNGNVGTGGSVAFNDSTAPLALGIVSVSCGATSGNSRIYFHNRGGGRLYSGGVFRFCFAAPSLTNVNFYIGVSNNGGSPWGLAYNSAINGGRFYLSTSNVGTVVFDTGVTPSIGDFQSGTRYIAELTRISTTQTKVVIKSAAFNSSTWTTVCDQTATHSAVTPAANGPTINVATSENVAKEILVDWYSMSFPAIR